MGVLCGESLLLGRNMCFYSWPLRGQRLVLCPMRRVRIKTAAGHPAAVPYPVFSLRLGANRNLTSDRGLSLQIGFDFGRVEHHPRFVLGRVLQLLEVV